MIRRRCCLIACLGLIVSAGLVQAELPDLAIRTAGGTFRVITNFDHSADEVVISDASFDATMRDLGDDVFELTITANEDLAHVDFPWKQQQSFLGPDDDIYYPFWLGLREKASEQCAWCWGSGPTLSYPGSLFAPLIITEGDGKTKLLAAQNWPPVKIHPMYSEGREILSYREPLAATESITLRFVETTVDGTWHDAMDVYRAWVEPLMAAEGLTDNPPHWMRTSCGFFNEQLENVADWNINTLFNDWLPHSDILPWVQCWGQMSNYAGPPELAVPPLMPGELTGCCLLLQDIHPRYDPALLDWIAGYADDDKQRVGFYTRPQPIEVAGPLTEMANADWLLSWQALNRDVYGTNAAYVDVIGASYFGDPLSVAHFINDQLDDVTFIESTVDIYPKPSLASGSYNVADPTPQFGRYLLNRRVMFLGESNGGHTLWGLENDHWMERQAFLLGMKFDAIRPNDFLRSVCNLRDAHNWWDLMPRYMDTKGLSVSDPQIDARLFIDDAGTRLVAVDNWSGITGATVTLDDGSMMPVPADAVSILEFGPPVPTVSEYGAMVLTVALLCVGGFVFRNRLPKSAE